MKGVILHIIKLFSCLLLLLMTACAQGELAGHPSGDGGTDGGDKIQIEIFTRANSYQLPSARATENQVNMTPWILVFKGEGAGAVFVEAVQAFEMASKRYVLLTRQPAGSKYQLLILANPQNNFDYGDAASSVSYVFNETNIKNKLTEGVTLGVACEKLLTEPLSDSPLTVLPYSGTNETIPMSYLLEVDQIDNTTKIATTGGESLLLTRIITKVVVENKATNFSLMGVVSVMNVPRQGRLHKIDNAVMDNTGNLTKYQYDADYLLAGANAITDGQSTAGNPIYLYESDTQNDMYLIIKGYYDSKVYYYKMAIVDGDLDPMALLRNCEYTFTITNAKGRGYDSLVDAEASKASNTDLDFKIIVDDSSSYEIMANNDYYLGVSNSVFILYGDKETEYEAFKLVTDCEINFPDAATIEDNESEVADWSFQFRSPADGRIPVVTEISTNPRITPVGVYVSNWLMYYEEGIDDRKNAYITLKLGNLEKQVHIRQRKPVPAEGNVYKYMPTYNIDTSGNEVNYFCLTGQVEDGDDNPKDWIKLRPSTMADREDTDRIIVEDGKIFIEVLPNTTSSRRNGIVYLTTIMPDGSYVGDGGVKRIKINITQLGRDSN